MRPQAPIDEPAIREEPRYLEREERNAFYESLPIDAKERFLRALRLASARGLNEDAAWREAVVAAETTYSPLPATEDDLATDTRPPLTNADLPRDERDAVEFDEKL